MTPQHHPSDATQIAFATAQLGAGAALVMACHVERCMLCADALRARQDGAFVADDPPRPGPGTGPGGRSRVATEGVSVADILEAEAPAAMAGLRHGVWRWAGPGVRNAMIRGAAGIGERVYLLRGQPGSSLARHGHAGSEWVMVLKGAYTDDGERFSPGDVSEHHESHVHSLKVTAEGECVCLVVTDRPPQLFGLARLLRPFVRL